MRISIGKNISRIYKELIFEKQYLYLYRTIIVQKKKNILGIIEIEFIENLYNTGLTDEKTILYKYWKNITCNYIEVEIVLKIYLK